MLNFLAKLFVNRAVVVSGNVAVAPVVASDRFTVSGKKVGFSVRSESFDTKGHESFFSNSVDHSDSNSSSLYDFRFNNYYGGIVDVGSLDSLHY